MLNLHWYVVLAGPVCTVFLFCDWQKTTSGVCYLDLMEWKQTVFWVSSPPSTTFRNFWHYKEAVLQWSCNVTGLARFVGNNILFRFLTRMISWEVLNFFANLRLPLSKNSDNFLIIIYGKSKVKFRLDWNHITKLHFKRSLKQKRDLTHISSWGLGQIWNQAKYLLTK